MDDQNTIWTDLGKWQTSMDEKDTQLARKKLIHDQKLPPVRETTEIIINDGLKPAGLEFVCKKLSQGEGNKEAGKPRMKPAEKAILEKDKGNACYQKQGFKQAVTHYTRAIELDPTNAVFFINRAMAHLKLEQYVDAEQDCTRGLGLQPTNVKALWRRGIARRSLGRTGEAREDLTKALEIEPSNKSVQEELSKLAASRPSSSSSPAAAEKQASKKREIQRKRLPIKVVDEAYPETTHTPKKAEVAPPKATPSQPKPAAANKPTEPATTPSADKPSTATTSRTQPTVNAPSSNNSQPTLTLSPMKFNPPKTNIEFERDWRACSQRGPDALYQYFQCIPPSSYGVLFRSSLESNQFEQMIELLETRYLTGKSKEDIYNVLRGLTEVRRIDMLVMFLGTKHKSALEGLVKSLEGVVEDSALKVLAKAYDVKL